MPARRSIPSLPSLDGLRAIAIVLMLLPPFASALGVAARQAVDRYTYFGALGARVFLVISGYLFTTLLLDERERTASIDLGRFYLRRALRVLPPFYGYLAAVAILAVAGLIRGSPTGLVAAATFTTNYGRDVGWYTGHTWLLAVQGQFYLLWPAAVALFGTRARWAAWAIVFLCPVFRWWTVIRLNGAYGFDHRFETTADLMAIGCLASIYAEHVRIRAREFPVPPTLVVVGLSVVTVFLTGLDHPRIDLLFGRTIAASAIAGMILIAVHATGSAAARVLRWAPLVWLGQTSYSLYLWQQVAFVPTGRSDALGVAVRTAIAFALALASYRLIERPVAARRDRLEALVRGVVRPGRTSPQF